LKTQKNRQELWRQVEGIKKLDPNASLLTEAAAAITGFEGAGAIAERLEKKDEAAEDKG
jgi:hypothetical protein